jgi:hypothetical protein
LWTILARKFAKSTRGGNFGANYSPEHRRRSRSAIERLQS